MATKRKPASKTGNRQNNRRKANSRKNTGIDYRWSILLFAIGALVTVLSIVPGESAWGWLRTNLLFGVFGISGWLVGPLLVFIAVLVGLEKPVLPHFLKCLLGFIVLSGAALVFSKVDLTGLGFGDVLKALMDTGRESLVGGGLLSLVLGWTLLALCGKVVARILMVLLLVVAVMVLTGITPADIFWFFKTRWDHRPVREPKEKYRPEPEYEDEPKISTPARRPIFDFFARKKEKPVDIDLGPTVAASDPGLAEHDEVVIGPGGTFGMNPLQERKRPAPEDDDPILPFDPYSTQSLLDDPMKDGELLFGADDPLLGMERPRPTPVPTNLFADGEETAAADTGFDILGRKEAPAPVFNETETVAATGTDVEALINKAAAKRPEEGPTGDTRPDDDYFQPYTYPPITLFKESKADDDSGAKEEMRRTAELLTSTLQSFGVETRILDVSRGPSVTRYEVQPQRGVKISKITNLADDIALNLAAAGVRIEAPIPGKPAVGIEVPNRIKNSVSIRSLLESAVFTRSESPLSMALGKDIAGDCVVADLTKMPHLLIAGSTGSGKSVCVNATIMSFLYKSSPDDLKLLLIDPKVVELAEYNGIPHLLMPVVTEPKKAAAALGATVAEMERRYHLFAENNVRDIKTFNKLAARNGDLEKLPYVAIVIDELADLMMVSGKDVENYICRIAQKARAAGMHLIVATQRPSVDVITGLIKANIPSRIAFAVSSQVDSRTILDGAGAEKLLGMGDMLFMPVGASKPVRIQGTYVQDKEISAVLRYIKQNGEVVYDEAMIAEMEKRAAAEDTGSGAEGGDASLLADPTFVNAVELAMESGQISTSNLQRRLRLGYARAGRIVDEMEQLGIISGPNGSKPREVLITRQDWLEMSMNAADR